MFRRASIYWYSPSIGEVRFSLIRSMFLSNGLMKSRYLKGEITSTLVSTE